MKFYTVKEAAEILRMHPQEVRKAIVEHRLGALRRGAQSCGAHCVISAPGSLLYWEVEFSS